MDKAEILNNARAAEFWSRHVMEAANAGDAAFFGGTHLKHDHGHTIARTILRLPDVEKVRELCNGTDVLVYHFYTSVLGMLLSHYETDFMFLSSAGQFSHSKNSDALFIVRPEIRPAASFKDMFAGGKNPLLEAAEKSLTYDFITEYFGERGLLDRILRFGMVVGEDIPAALNNVNTLFQFVTTGEQPYLEIKVKGTLYDPALLRLFGENFNTLLHDVITRIYEPVQTLEWRSEEEKALLADINTVAPYFPIDRHIIEKIEENGVLYKDKVAMSHLHQQITYGELCADTNRLSRYLHATLTLQRDDRIGVMMPRSIDMVKSIYAVWKSGCAYVPVGTTLPDDNLLQIIEDSGMKAIITDNDAMLEQLGRLSVQVPVIRLDNVRADIDSFPDTPVDNGVQLNDLAYVIYTSGSTGKPKGVMIEHLGMINHMGAKIIELSIGAESVVAQNAPHTFDISIWQQFSPLVAGGRGIIYDTDFLTDAKAFLAGIAADRVTVLELVPSYLLEMLYQLENEKTKTVLSLQTLVLNAETLTKATAARWQVLYPEIPILNTYGATEVSDDMCHYVVPVALDTYSVPVMRKPIQHFEVHIVDEDFQPVPVGVKGEILLVGPAVGRGYINDEAKTKAAFLQGPLPGITSQVRIYKTGDMGRYSAGGTMEFLGRNDNQIKILGHRIELDAIENIVSAIPQVDACKAIAYIDRQLIALYYVADAELERAVIEDALRSKLPKYMLPAAYIQMDTFPVTTNGKIDKNSLPDPDEFLSNKTAYVAPSTATEIALATIWQSILDVEQVGTADNFFDLGGHSLKLMRLRNEYQERFEVKVELRSLFENPTLDAQAKLIEESGSSRQRTISRIPDAPNYAISDGQKRIWILSQFDGGSVVYNMPQVVPIEKSIKVKLLKKAIAATIDRHEILRTVFREDESGDLRQWILGSEDIHFELQEADYSRIKDPARKIAQYVSSDNARAFDLENGPLFRATLFRTGKSGYSLYYNIHHIIGDAWSTEILFRDIMAFYTAFEENTTPALPPLTIHYRDFAAWQLENMAEPAFAEHEKFWQDTFKAPLPLLELPSTLRRPAANTHNGHLLRTYVPAALAGKLKAFCLQEGGSLFMGLLTALNALFHRYTRKEDFIIGSPIAGRDHKLLEDQIGFYLNALALRNAVTPEDTFHTLFNRVRTNTLEAYKHQQYPFDRLTEKLELVRDTSRNPLFDVNLVLLNAAGKDVADTADDDVLEIGEGYAKFDIVLICKEAGDRISIIATYNRDVYEQEMITGLLRHFKQLLSALLEQPAAPLGSLNMITPAETNQIIHTFNQPLSLEDHDNTVISLFREQAVAKPQATAIICNGQSTSYQELDHLSDQFAHYLVKEQQIRPGDFVSLEMNSSEWLIIAQLAIFKAGAVYVPVDPNYPEQRKQFMYTNSACKLKVDDTLLEQYRQQQTAGTFTPLTTQQATAYVMYTSGSTGTPKGVMISHRNLLDYTLTFKDKFGINAADVSIQQASISFDTTVKEIFPVLISGGTVVVHPQRNDFDALCALCEQHGVTVLSTNPFILQYLNQHHHQYKFRFRHLISGGDVLQPAYIDQLRTKATVHNMYGPTETTVNATSFEVTGQLNSLPIGRPLHNREVYILEAGTSSLLPVYISGEICIGGIGLSQGYLGRPDLTAEKFVPHPFRAGELLYRSGDAGRWLPDGNIEFLGRIDQQVKIRGHRIELEEIQYQLRQKAGVSDALVLPHTNAAGETDLVAYVIAAQPEDIKGIQEYLGKSLPVYMVPAHLVQLERFPVTAHGKTDLRALPQPVIAPAAAQRTAPVNEIEEQLIAIWSKILNRDAADISTDAGFFTLGGNSLLMIKLWNGIRTQFNVKLPVVALFQSATVQLQAQMLLKETTVTPVTAEKTTTAPVVEEKAADAPQADAPIAVIGMSLKVPGAPDVQRFWENICNGVEAIQHFSEEELKAGGVSEKMLSHKDYVRAGSYLEGKQYFDAAFFGYLPAEARLMDPQTRVLHEIVWTALEDAGCDPLEYDGRIGLYTGAHANMKWQIHSMLDPQQQVDAFSANHLSDKDFANALIAFRLNLKGSVNTIYTACSTSLVAIHHAVTSLRRGENDLAIAGGVAIRSSLKEGYVYQDGMILSKDGYNRSFDEQADGTVSGEGAGAVVLKRLDKAIADGDNILAVIKGSAINNDGARKVGFAAPSVDGQAAVIRMAQQDAGVAPHSISYVEAQGIATRLGDPIEIEALTQAFGESSKKYCALGTVKSNIGHLDAAAGVTGFIKTVLCLQHKQLVPSLRFKVPNPNIDFERGPFYVNTSLQKWEAANGPLRAGVSSFAIGGTNAHVVLEEAPTREQQNNVAGPHLIPLSAKTSDALKLQQQQLKTFVQQHPGVPVASIARTLQTGRAKFAHRCYMLADTIADITVAPELPESVVKGGKKEIVLLFAGENNACLNMGRALYEQEPVFRTAVERIAGNVDYKTGLYPDNNNAYTPITDVAAARPLTFIVEYALAQLLAHYGVTFTRALGTGAGAYTAACINGTLTPEAALHKLITGEGPEADDTVITEKLFTEEQLLITAGPGNILPDLHAVRLLDVPGEDKRQLLSALGQLWTSGVAINWARLYEGIVPHNISLPSYPFEKTVYPLGEDIFRTLYQQWTAQETAERKALSGWFYEPSWKRATLAATLHAHQQGHQLVFMDDAGLGETLAAGIGQAIRVTTGDDYAQLSSQEFVLNPADHHHYHQLFDDLAAQQIHPAGIIHLFSLSALPEATAQLHAGLYSLLHIADGLHRHPSPQPVQLTVVTAGVETVTGQEQASPMAVTAPGILRVLAQENPQLRVKHIDVLLQEDQPALGTNILREINAGTAAKTVAYRFNHRWVKTYNTIPVADTTGTTFRKNGVYLITGGLGNVGITCAAYLLEKYNAALIITGRNALNAATEQRLKALTAKGRVVYYQADSADADAMREAVSLGESALGSIHGIIHAAGVSGGPSFREAHSLRAADCAQHFAPKVAGTEVLAALFRDKALDCCLLMSSISTVLGGPTLAAATAANMYLGHVAETGIIPGSTCIDLDRIDFNGNSAATAITPAEIPAILETALSLKGIPRIVVSVTDLLSRIDRPDHVVVKEEKKTIDRDSISTPYAAPVTETQTQLCQLLETFFSCSGIGIHDNFFEMGGDSLKAMTVSNHIYRQFNVQVPLKDFFTNPTISTLAAEIDLGLAFSQISTNDVSRQFENEILI